MTKKARLWVSTGDVCAHLGISSKTLYRYRSSGVFTYGYHYRSMNRCGAVIHYRWHLSRIEKLLSLPPDQG